MLTRFSRARFEPPPIAVGAALLCWGFFTGLWIPAIAAALLCEVRWFVPRRWDLSEQEFLGFWYLCMILVLMVIVFNLITGNIYSTFHVGMTWAPILFLPIVAAQLWSLENAVPLHTMVILLRQQRRLDLRLGRPVTPARMIHLGWPYIALALVCSGVARSSGWTFFGICTGFLLLAILVNASRPRRSMLTLAAALLVAVAAGVIGLKGYNKLYMAIMNLTLNSRDWISLDNSNALYTRIGDIQKMQKSDKIDWQLKRIEGKAAHRGARSQLFAFRRQQRRLAQQQSKKPVCECGSKAA